MKYKYNIQFKDKGKKDIVNFKSKDRMIAYLEKNRNKLNKLEQCHLNFSAITLPLKCTVWNDN